MYLTYIIYLTKCVICILPTGYGKSLIFHLTPLLMFAREHIKQVDFLSPWKSLEISTHAGRFVYCYRCVSREFTDTRSNISTEIKWPSRVCHSINIRKKIFHGKITIVLHILGLNRDY
jgi:ERCC4-related helicase